MTLKLVVLMHAKAHVKVRGKLQESVFFFYHVCPGDPSQVVRLDGKCL